MNKIDMGDVISGVVLVGIIGFVGYILKGVHKMNRVADMVGRSLDDLVDNVNLEISESIVDEAVKQAAKKEAKIIVKKAADNAVKEIRDDISSEVRNALQSVYSNVKSDVAKELRNQIADLDIDDIKEEAVEEAKNKAAEKFDNALNDILANFNENLQNVVKIYSSIAKTVSDKAG